jgi:hypothetical protein
MSSLSLIASSCRFWPEWDSDNSENGPNRREDWRPSFTPAPTKSAQIFLPRTRYSSVIYATTRIRIAREIAFWTAIVRPNGGYGGGEHLSPPQLALFTIENYVPFRQPAPSIDIQVDLPIFSYNALEPSVTVDREIHGVVKYDGKLYVLKSAQFPGDEQFLSEELHNYRLLKGSKWVAELGGVGLRQWSSGQRPHPLLS